MLIILAIVLLILVLMKRVDPIHAIVVFLIGLVILALLGQARVGF